jgi:hypothetical protein
VSMVRDNGEGGQTCICVTGLDSLSPYACFTSVPNLSCTAKMSSLLKGAAPEVIIFSDERSYFSTTGDFARCSTTGGATYVYVILWSWMIAQNFARSKDDMTIEVSPAKAGKCTRHWRPTSSALALV